MEGAQARLTLGSTSPQRRAILEQLRIPFEAVAPDYVEHDPPDADPVALVRTHAEGKARSVHRPGAFTLGVDTTVHLDGPGALTPHTRPVLANLRALADSTTLSRTEWLPRRVDRRIGG